MSKMSEMAITIQDLRRCAAAISDAADWLSEQFQGSEPTPAEPAPLEPAIPLETVRATLADKSRAGFTAQVRSLLLKYGADRLSGIDPIHYKALIEEAEALKDAT